MNYLRRHDIRNIAEKVVEAYKEQTHLTADIFTMNIESLVDLLGFELIKIRFGEDSDVLGFTAFRYQRTTVVDENGNEQPLYLSKQSIVVNESLKESCIGRYNFTIAHEAGHQLINDAYGLNYQQKYRMAPHYYRRGSVTYDADEVMANQLASYLLMPDKPIRTVFRRAFGRSRVEVITPEINREHYNKFNRIAKIFGVSREALKIRLQQMGMLGDFREYRFENSMDIFPDDQSA